MLSRRQFVSVRMAMCNYRYVFGVCIIYSIKGLHPKILTGEVILIYMERRECVGQLLLDAAAFEGQAINSHLI